LSAVSSFFFCFIENEYFSCSLNIHAGYFFSKKFAVFGPIYPASSTFFEEIMPFSN
jgi:hypothetical protein